MKNQFQVMKNQFQVMKQWMMFRVGTSVSPGHLPLCIQVQCSKMRANCGEDETLVYNSKNCYVSVYGD